MYLTLAHTEIFVNSSPVGDSRRGSRCRAGIVRLGPLEHNALLGTPLEVISAEVLADIPPQQARVGFKAGTAKKLS